MGIETIKDPKKRAFWEGLVDETHEKLRRLGKRIYYLQHLKMTDHMVKRKQA